MGIVAKEVPKFKFGDLVLLKDHKKQNFGMMNNATLSDLQSHK